MSLLRDWLRRLEGRVPERASDPARLAEMLAAMESATSGGPDLSPADVQTIYGDIPTPATAGARLAELAERRAADEQPQPETSG